MNEVALDTDTLHKYSEKYNKDIYEQLIKWKNKTRPKLSTMRSKKLCLRMKK